jgi:hypothetical protein
MQYQVSQLQESFGHSGGESGGNLQELVLAWVAAGPVATDLYVKLLARFRLST